MDVEVEGWDRRLVVMDWEWGPLGTRMREYTLSSIPSLHSWCNGHSISINVCGV